MERSQDLANFENMIEKIIFNDNELKNLKIAIKNFTEGKVSAKELKGLLLQCWGRMVEDITDFAFFFVEKRIKAQLQTEKSKEHSTSPTKVESQLREEIKEKNELLETVARRVNKLVSRLNDEDSQEGQKPISIEEVKEEIERCLNQIGAAAWIEVCYYDDLNFFVKLYPKLEALYKERFGESEEIMANKMVKLGFPKDIETIVVKYIIVRNNFQHSMTDLSPSNLELAREVFATVFVDLIVSNLESTLLLNNRENFYLCLKDFFSHRLTGNPIFRKEILERLETIFNV